MSSGAYGFVSDYVYEFNSSSFIHSAIFFLIFYFVNLIITIPINYYSIFIIEEKFGFNKTTLRTFFMDVIKGSLMSLFIGGLLLAAAIFLYDYFTKDFWIWLWLGLSLFVVFMSMFYTTLIVPIFNKLSPLENGTLKDKIENYSKEIGYSLKNIFIIDGSRRSTKANAYFSGLGPKKTIALFDTLVENHTDEELVAVLAHEVGHYKKNHIKQGMVFSIMQIGFMCYLFELCVKLPDISTALGAEIGAFHLGLIGFSLLFSPIGLILGILGNIISRKNEFEADNYAKEYSEKQHLISSLLKLYRGNLSLIKSSPLYSAFYYSHPSVFDRIENLEK